MGGSLKTMQIKPSTNLLDGRNISADKFLNSFDASELNEVQGESSSSNQQSPTSTRNEPQDFIPITPIPVIIDYENEAMYNLARRLSNTSDHSHAHCGSVNFGEYRPTRKSSIVSLDSQSRVSSRSCSQSTNQHQNPNEIKTKIHQIRECNLKIRIKKNKLKINGEQMTTSGYQKLEKCIILPDYMTKSSLQKKIQSRIEKDEKGERYLLVVLPEM